MDLARQRAHLVAALAVTQVTWRDPEPPIVTALKRWLNSWPGVGINAAGMRRHGYDLHLSYDREGWRATFLLRHGAGLYPCLLLHFTIENLSLGSRRSPI